MMIRTRLFQYDRCQYYNAGSKRVLEKFCLQIQRLQKLSIFFKSHPVTILTDCVHNCECLMAYKLRQGQQMCSLYSKLWGETRFKELVNQLRQKWTQQLALRTRTFMLSSGMLTMFDWNTNRIADSYLKEHYADLDHVKCLKEQTVTCQSCKKRLPVDKVCPNIVYCTCLQRRTCISRMNKDTWMPFIEREDILVWRREEAGHKGLYEYKVLGVYKEIKADVFFKVQIDADYRKQWDATAVQVKVVESDSGSQSDVLYWEMQWPKFFSNRDYVFNRRYVIDRDKKVIVITNQITEHPAMPEVADKFRVKEYYCTMVIKPTTRFEEPGLEFCMTYFDNPGLSIPGPIQTWVATSAMPDFLARLREASRDYPVTEEDSHWSDTFNVPGMAIFDDFATMFLVDDSPSRIEDSPIFNFFKNYFFPS